MRCSSFTESTVYQRLDLEEVPSLGCKISKAPMADTFPITPSGLRRMKDELKHLHSVERPRITLEIEVARAHGDLRENAEYHAAKEKQGHIEGRIMDLNGWIARAEVIDPQKYKDRDKVVFGATVELMDTENEKKVTYRLVGEFE